MQTRHASLALVFIIATACSHSANALWPEGGLGVATGAGQQTYASSVPDGAGGAIIVWHDSSEAAIYAQRVDGYGVPQWAPGGTLVRQGTALAFYTVTAADGAGGVVMAWADTRQGNYDVYAQRLDAQGTPLWTAGGVGLCTFNDHQYPTGIATDGAGGAIVAWVDFRLGSSSVQLYAGRITGAGVAPWPVGGVAVSPANWGMGQPRIAADGRGGAFITWDDGTPGNYFVYAQRLDSAGAKVWNWATNGILVKGYSGQNATSPKIASLGADGAVIAWYDTRGFVFAQKVSSAGNLVWTADGVAMCGSPSGGFDRLQIVADGAGGAIAVWVNLNWSAMPGVYAQRLNAQGAAMWSSCGVPLCTVAQNYSELSIAADGAGGVVAAWDDDRAIPNQYGVYCQRVGSGGYPLWAQNGVQVGRQTAATRPRAIADGAGGIIVAWLASDLDYGDVRAQRVERNGFWGFPAPEIVGVRDVPGDQGGRVNLAWNASRLDPWPHQQIYQYTIWRALDPVAAKAAAAAGERGILGEDFDTKALVPGDVRLQLLAGAAHYWQLINTIYAWSLDGYSDVVPTLSDSTGVANELHHFQVMAHSYSGFWASAPGSGYSVDNLAPAQPAPFTGRYTGSSTALHWDPVDAADLAGYQLHRGDSVDFLPGAASLVVAQPDTGYVDQEPGVHFYKLCAVDVHGNPSPYAVLAPAQTSPVPAAVGEGLRLHQNAPNPFNPQTTIAFDLPQQGAVRLQVYDIAGRLVRTLIAADLAPGRHRAVWDGRDTQGRGVSSGSYLARLEFGHEVRTMRMGLVK